QAEPLNAFPIGGLGVLVVNSLQRLLALLFPREAERLDAEHLIDAAVDARDALHLSLRPEALVESLDAEVPLDIAPAAQLVGPALGAIVRIAVGAMEIGADSHQRLERHRPRHHVALVAP